MNGQELDTSRVTRFEVIDHSATGSLRGRILVRYGVGVEVQLQDDGRTLKVYMTNSAVASWDEVLAEMQAGRRKEGR